MDIVTSWERRGIEKGREEGREEGRAIIREVVVEILLSRFGQLDAATLARVNEMAGIEELLQLTRRALRATSLDELAL